MSVDWLENIQFLSHSITAHISMLPHHLHMKTAKCIRLHKNMHCVKNTTTPV